MGTRFTPTAHSSPRPPAAHPHPRAGGEHRWTDSILGTFPSPEQEQDEPRVGGGGAGRLHVPDPQTPGGQTVRPAPRLLAPLHRLRFFDFRRARQMGTKALSSGFNAASAVSAACLSGEAKRGSTSN